MVEEKVSSTKGASSSRNAARSTARPVNQIETTDEPRYHMPSEELNRVLGGGLVRGSIVLIGGEPGIGKAPLCYRTCLR